MSEGINAPEQSSSLITHHDSAHTEVEELEPLIAPLKAAALEYATAHENQLWILDILKHQKHLDGIVSDMRHLKGGQEFILEELKKMKPDLCWYRGGRLQTWREAYGRGDSVDKHFTPEQLETHVIDGGANGVLGRKLLALGFIKHTHRQDPVLYTLTLDDLLTGIRDNAIGLGSEHQYDLCVREGENRTKYLAFCKNNLKIQSLKSIQQETGDTH